jgi:hypothetical protein
VPVGWLQLPARDVVLDLRHQALEYGCRKEAGEFLISILNLLVQAGYTVRLSDGFLLEEINYYVLNQEKEKPVKMTQAVLACLRAARLSHVLDWDCFKAISKGDADLLAGARHLPWMSPPFGSEAVKLIPAGGTNLPQLHLNLRWSGIPTHGAVQHARRPGGLTGETVLLSGEGMLWRFSAEMRLQDGKRVLFEKSYPQDAWQKTYISAYQHPAERNIERILQDLDTGLKPKPEPAPVAKGKKRRTRS